MLLPQLLRFKKKLILILHVHFEVVMTSKATFKGSKVSLHFYKNDLEVLKPKFTEISTNTFLITNRHVVRKLGGSYKKVVTHPIRVSIWRTTERCIMNDNSMGIETS